MRIFITVEALVEDKVFEELKELHGRPDWSVGTEEQYEKAIKIVEETIGLPFYANQKTEDLGKPYFSAIDTLDNISLLE
jgi:hypothetical protein